MSRAPLRTISPVTEGKKPNRAAPRAGRAQMVGLALGLAALLVPGLAAAQCFSGGVFVCSESSASTTAPILEITSTGSTGYAAIDGYQSGSGTGVGAVTSGGTGATAVTGSSSTPGGMGVYGQADDTSATYNYGVFGESKITGGAAVYGSNSSSANTGVGVYGGAPSGYGVYGSGQAGVLTYALNSGAYGMLAYSYQLLVANQALSVTGQSDFFGDVTVVGSGTYTGTWQMQSDARLKKNVAPLGPSLARLLALRGVSFEWIDPAKHGGESGVQDGLIAQEVETVFPGWVHNDRNGYKTLSTGPAFSAVATESIRELNAREDRLTKRIQELDARLEKAEQAPEARGASVLPTGDWAEWGLVAAGFGIGGVLGRVFRRSRKTKGEGK